MYIVIILVMIQKYYMKRRNIDVYNTWLKIVFSENVKRSQKSRTEKINDKSEEQTWQCYIKNYLVRQII